MKPVYITWDVLTYGIRRGMMDKQSPLHPKGAYIFIDGNTDSGWFSKKDFFTRKAMAIKSADRKRMAKIIQLKREIERLERMEFS